MTLRALVIPAYPPRRSLRSLTSSVSASSPAATHDGGWFQQANEDDFPILKGQEASLLMLTLQPGGIREPHWHPSAWELNIVTRGVATWVVIDGNGNHEASNKKSMTSFSRPRGHFTTSRTAARTT